MKRLARLLASGFGVGYVPIAPGTVASALALLPGAALMRAPVWALPLSAGLAGIGGGLAIGLARVAGDPGWIVIDEITGQWITLLGLARATPAGLIVAFGLFRLFDIAKPGPVGWADRRGGALGIMADDVIAGALAAAALRVMRAVWPGSFE
jgi:phosphatidylglycerophosphatase A